MSHTAQKVFCEYIKGKLPQYFYFANVVDFGSLDINGCNRYLFQHCNYVGVDIGPGRNVDVISLCHLYGEDEEFDTVISTEMLEHDRYWKESLQNMVRVLKRGGLLLFTCKSEGSKEHGTINSDTESSPFTSILPNWCQYYKNLTEEDIRSVLDVDSIFQRYTFSIHEDWETSITGKIVLAFRDLRFWGIKK